MIRVGIAGTSWWTESMYLPALADHPDASVVALCGRDADNASALAGRWGVESVYTDWHELLTSGIDAVIIATPNETHVPIARAALAAGIHVLCEKPVALDADEARDLAVMAHATGLNTMVPFTYRYMPMFAATKELIDAGEIGQPHHLDLRYFAQYALDGEYAWRFDRSIAGSGVIGDLGSHWLHCAEWLFGPIAELGCVSASLVERDNRPDGAPYDRAEDSCIMHARFDSGALGSLQVCAVSWEGTPFGQVHQLDAHGASGTIHADSDWDRAQQVRFLRRGDAAPGALVDLPGKWPGVRFDTVHNTYRDIFRGTDAMTRRWVSDIAAGRPSTPDLAAGARVQVLVDAAIASAAAGGQLIATPTSG